MAIKKRRHQKGMTLVEMLVTVGLLSVVSLLVISSFPATRQHQKLIASEQAVQSFIRQAQQMALDQMREEACLETVATGDEKLCAKIGVAFLGNEVRFFADTINNNRYTDGNDYEIVSMRTSLSEGVNVVSTNGVWQSIVFEATPPVVVAHAFAGNDSSPVVLNSENPFREITLRAGRGRQQVLQVHAYGQVEKNN